MSTNRLMRRIGQVGVVLTAAGLAVLLGGGIATAHVTAKVIGEPAKQGGFTKITFRVPNEDDAAGTVKLEVKVPPETPIASLRTKPVPGWTAVVTKGKLPKPIMNHDAEVTEGVTSVTWTADPGVKIKPGEFGEFEVSGGPMPATDKLMLPAVQTYDNGKVVSWDAPPPAQGAEEPEHPAPVVALAPADAADAAAAVAPANSAQAGTGGGTNAAAATSTTDTTARWLGGIGLVVGALGLGFGAGATLRARRTVAAAAAKEDTSP
jgi:periplasmic copper chaperone A